MRLRASLRWGWWLVPAFLAILAVSCTNPPAPGTPAVATPGTAATTTAGTGTAAAPGTFAFGSAINVAVAISRPANGTNFVAGEQPIVTITLKDQSGKTLNRAEDFANFRLLASGPIETADTTTAVKLLKTTDDRSVTTHHYVDLTKNTDVQVSGNVLTFRMGAVSDEKPGTYTAGVYAVSKADGLQQAVATADFQIGTATIEKQIVDRSKCEQCHLGADSGKLYFAHIDPRQEGQPGNWAIDQAPVTMCKTCHNNNGYAAYVSPADGTTRVPDPIVKRVHGIHMGEHLKNPENTDPAKGVFRSWTDVIFPANVENCATCHADDRWKTKPSQQACGTCHDAAWFGDPTKTPAKLVAHKGGPQANDSGCAGCHPADTGGVKSVADSHKVSQPLNAVDVAITPPANGKFYAAGDKPKITLTIKDNDGKAIDHTTVEVANFSTAGLYVYGPRANSVPVLTSIAKNGDSKIRASASNSIAATGDTTKGWTFAADDTFKIAVNGNAPQVLQAPVGLQTPAQVKDWLAANLTDVTVTATATNVSIRSSLQGQKSRIEFYDSPVTKKMGWKPGPLKRANGQMTAGVTMEPYVVVGALSYPTNDLRKLSDPLDYVDPNVTRTQGNINYQLDDIAGLTPGTYMIYAWIQPVANKMASFTRAAIGFKTFQIGTEKEDLKVATNCTQCHGNTIWHLDTGPVHPEPFDADYCKACHDYARFQTGDSFSRLGGTSLAGWSGYGAVPISRRVHGLHFGLYLDHPEQIYAGNPDVFSESVFPQDIRNCSKCHDLKATTAAWKEQPSRLACMACHDSDKANAHAILMTQNPTPNDPWNPARVETCTTCHGAGKEFAVDKMHNVSKPYKPPYVREPE